MPTTTTKRHRLSIVAIAALLVAGGAGSAGAQQPIGRVVVRASESLRADSLVIQADAMADRVKNWRMAASLYLRAADLRDAADPRGVSYVVHAAHLYHGSGDARTARWLLERAASRAESRGDVVAAAEAYVDAGLIALEQGYGDKASRFASKAEALSSSPLLNAEQRDRIRARTGYGELAFATLGR